MHWTTVGDGRSLPEVLNQFLFTDQGLAAFQQMQKQMERLLAEMLFYSASLEAATRGVDLDILETVDGPK